MSKELTQATSSIQEQAHVLEITTQDEANTATEFLSKANKLLDNLTEEEEKITAPLNAAIKAARAPLAAPKKALKETIEILRSKLSIYQTSATKAAALETQRIAQRITKGSLKLETGIRKLDEIDAPESKIEVTSGSLTFRPKTILKINDASLIPRIYLTANEDLILETIKNGNPVPGCEISIVQVPINRRA